MGHPGDHVFAVDRLRIASGAHREDLAALQVAQEHHERRGADIHRHAAAGSVGRAAVEGQQAAVAEDGGAGIVRGAQARGEPVERFGPRGQGRGRPVERAGRAEGGVQAGQVGQAVL